MKKNLFKKQSIIDTVVNVGIGGATNATIDAAVETIAPGTDDRIVNAAKIVLGAVGGGMTTNKMVRAAVDGVAVVGASNLINMAIDGTLFESKDEGGNGSGSGDGANGLPYGTVGRIKMGNRTFLRRTGKKVSGLEGAFGK